MPIGSLYSAKENASAKQPLLLATITFSDGAVLRVASHDVNYGGNDYLPYIENHELTASQALGEQGIDVPTSVNLRLADSDYTLWTNYEIAHGFRGARLHLVSVLYDALAGGFSSDSRVIFNGVCKEPGGRMAAHDGKVLTVGFASRLNMADIGLPVIKVQKICPWIFPTTLAERQDGADNTASLFYRCGYSPDASGANARGNLDGGSAFTTCDFTAESCMSRGMFSKDSADRVTGRFGGIQWNPPSDTYTVKNYISGKEIDVKADPNEAKYGDYIPMLWGRNWTDPLVLHVIPDGNFVTINALVCFGEPEAIFGVVVNDVHIPHTYDDPESPLNTGIGVPNATEAAKGGWWKCINKGDRDGTPTVDGQDPYGSLCVLQIVVPHKVVNPGSMPRVRVYCQRGSSWPSEQLQDILQNWAGWDSTELNTSSFTAAQAVDAGVLTVPGAGSGYRFTSSLYLRSRESMSDVLRGLRNSRRGILTADSSGLLKLSTEQTLADQQPSPVTGSNYNSAITSKTAAGVTANGYAAYKFDESNIIGMPSVSFANSGNRFTLSFQNAQNLHSQDALQVIDSEDIRRVDQEVPGTFTLRGADNYDQVKRLIATYTAKQLRGNWRQDTGGTVLLDIQASFRAVHLSIGDLVIVNWELLGIENQLFRVQRISPDTNFETAKLTLAWHNDDWYTDAWGQGGVPASALRFRDRLRRPAFAWKPYGVAPETGDSLFGPTEYTFTLAPKYERGAGEDPLAGLVITGKQPVNVVAESLAPPVVPIQGDTSSTGGTLNGGQTVYVAIASKNASGEYSGLSPVVLCYIPSGTDTNTVTVPDISWPSDATGYALFAGVHSQSLSFQFEDSTTPTSITVDELSESLWGPPDSEFDRMRIKVKKIWHGGVWGAQVVSVTSDSIQVAVSDPGFTTDEYAGYDVSWIGRIDSQAVQPLASFRIASNTADTLTLAPGAPDPLALGLDVGDVIVLRSKPTFGTDGTGDYVEDAAWQSCFYPGGLVADEERGRILRIIAGTGKGTTARIKSNTETKIYCDFDVQPDSTTRYIIEDPKWDTPEDTAPLNNADPTATLTLQPNVSNFIGQTILVQAVALDGGGNEAVEAFCPFREVYLFGQGLIWKTVTSDYEMTQDDHAILADCTGGDVSVTLPPVIAGRKRSRRFMVKKFGGENTLSVYPPDGATLDGSAVEILTDDGAAVIYAGDEG